MRRVRGQVARPATAQRGVLSSLVERARETAFGRDHGFHPDMTVLAFQERVPVRDYEGLKGYVDRAVAGEQDVLWPGEPLYFCKTSGTTSGAKFIPLTADSMPNHIGSARNAGRGGVVGTVGNGTQRLCWPRARLPAPV